VQARLQGRDLVAQVLGFALGLARGGRLAAGAGDRPADQECDNHGKRPQQARHGPA